MDTPVAEGRELTIPGLDDPDSDHPDGDVEFLAFGDADDFRPERMDAFRCTTHTAAGNLSYHADRPAGAHIPSTSSGWVQAASLSFLSASPYDVRSPMLALMRWQQESAMQPCLTYGVHYLSTWCQRASQRPRQEVIEAAVSDALMLVYWGRMKRASKRNPVAIPTVEQRRVTLKVDKGRFERYRNLMETVFLQRLTEARSLYQRASHYQRVQNTDYRAKGFINQSLWIKSHDPASKRGYKATTKRHNHG
jgi:hypothetical protein